MKARPLVAALGAVLLATPAVVLGDPVAQRPLADFLSQQGTYCTPDGSGGCFLWFPPAPNYLGWASARSNAPAILTAFALVDYAGLANRWLVSASGGAIDLGTQVTGLVTERALPNGLAEVSVRLRTTNALTWAIACPPDYCDYYADPAFGNRADAVLAGAPAAVASVGFNLRFTNTAPGSTLPDLTQLIENPAPGQQLLGYALEASAKGPYCDGSPGTLNVSQTGNARRQNFQAAVINFHGPLVACP